MPYRAYMTVADHAYLSATVPRDDYNKCQSNLIDMLGQRNHYRMRAHEAEQTIAHLLHYIDSNPIINRTEIVRLLGC